MTTFKIFTVILFLFINTMSFAAPLNVDCKQACGKFDVNRDDSAAAARCLKECEKCKDLNSQNIYSCTDDAAPTCKCL